MGLNTVEVDPAALDEEAARILGELPPELASSGTDDAPSEAPPAGDDLTLEQLQAIATGYEPGAFLLVSQAANIIVPAWELSAEERRALSGSVAVAMAAWFPDQKLPPKYAALLGLAGTLYGIVEARRDPTTGKLKPRRVIVDASTAAAAASVSTAAA